ncbi:hypothetical protein MyNCGM70_61170 [Achromobacter xylosoxidans]|nr:hypothetical protein BIZ53_31385 [Achromobacter xylosoxidans]
MADALIEVPQRAASIICDSRIKCVADPVQLPSVYVNGKLTSAGAKALRKLTSAQTVAGAEGVEPMM